MKTIWLVLLSLCTFYTCKVYAQAPKWQWAKSGKGDGWDEGHGIATDLTGNVYTTGFFGGDSIRFGEIVLRKDTATPNASFIAKYDNAGKALWAHKIKNSQAYGVAVDAKGNIYVTGNFSDGDFGAGDLSLKSKGAKDVYIVKYDAAGNMLWARGGGGQDNDIANAVTTDSYGNVFVTGYFNSSSIAFGKYKLSSSSRQHSKGKLFLLKYDSSGNVCWLRAEKSNGIGDGQSVASDGQGNICLCGGFYGKHMILGNCKLSNKTQQSTNAFIARYNNLGHVLWAKGFNCTGFNFASSVKMDSAGNIYAAGYFAGSYIVFDNDTLTKSGAGFFDMFLVKYTAAGKVLWARGGGGFDQVLGDDICVNSIGDVYVTGDYNRSANFGRLSLNTQSPAAFQTYIARYNSLGQVIWVKGVQGLSNNAPRNICLDKSGRIYVCGEFRDASFICGDDTLNSVGEWDVFVGKLDGE